MTRELPKVVALSGGVGGARLLHGLSLALPPSRLTAVVNTGDDFEHWGLTICPDLDTCMYTLAGLADEKRGWGLRDETWNALSMVKRQGREDWFQLGDRDLATHVLRTADLREGRRLTEVTQTLAQGYGVAHRLLPMCDRPRRTIVHTRESGPLPFQRWLVRARAEPLVEAVEYRGETEATEEVYAALEEAECVILCPSNPYVSLEPIATLAGVRERLIRPTVVGVSPIVHGRAVKGPLATMLRSIDGQEPSAASVAERYAPFLDGFVVEEGDEGALTLPHRATRTVMRDRDDRARLAQEVLDFAMRLRK